MITRTCKQCGRQFEIEDGEIKFYQDKNLSLPKRCKECRKLNNKSLGNNSNRQKNRNIGGISGKNRFRFGFIGICLILWLVFYLSSLISDNEKPVSNVITPDTTREETVVPYDEKPISDGVTPDTAVETVVSYDEKPISNEINPDAEEETAVSYEFRNERYLQEHYDKHGAEFGYNSPEEYLEGANNVICAEGVLHKLEAEDGDDVYYLERTNEFVIISTDGYIRTYFKPDDGINYYNRQ